MYQSKWIFGTALLLLYSIQMVFVMLKIAAVVSWSSWLVCLLGVMFLLGTTPFVTMALVFFLASRRNP